MHTPTQMTARPGPAPGSDAWFEQRTEERQRAMSVDELAVRDELTALVGVDPDDLSARARWALAWLAGLGARDVGDVAAPELLGVRELLHVATQRDLTADVVEIISCPCGERVSARQLARHLAQSPRHAHDGGVA